MHKIVGPATSVTPDPALQIAGTHTFQLALNRVNSTEDCRNFDIWVWASHPGDATYKSIVQQASIRVPHNTEGAEQRIDFPTVPDQKNGALALNLNATSDAELKVSYYVLDGPAEADGDVMTFTPLPPRAKFPVRVTVVAWQHGLLTKVKNRRAGEQGIFDQIENMKSHPRYCFLPCIPARQPQSSTTLTQK